MTFKTLFARSTGDPVETDLGKRTGRPSRRSSDEIRPDGSPISS